ncbi:MAG: protein-L-isoaspartate(D-aspartate) O-methyltransferase [Candidatus Aerophobetes bacterium]|nr:protein-L-isoaspartate(D-aspartate) O-methyltransferase [Candidatus Aerophobetes bacterium]
MNYRRLREKMVKNQLIPRGIKDEEVLSVFHKVERERFVPPELQNNAYEDSPLSIGEGQTISQPYMVALMTQSLELKRDKKVLEIGTGSGYQTAILAELSKMVYTIERIGVLAEKAKKVLNELEYTNVKIIVGDGTLGWEEFSPYDRILATAGAKRVSLPLINQLKEEGILVIPIGDTHYQQLKVIRKEKNEIKSKSLERCVFVPLIGRYGWNEDEVDE